MENQLPNLSSALRMVYLLEQLVSTSPGGSGTPTATAPATYAISDADEAAASPKYYGFLKADGAWYILKVTAAAGVSGYTYVAGTTGYAAAWTGRAGQTYTSYDVTF